MVFRHSRQREVVTRVLIGLLLATALPVGAAGEKGGTPEEPKPPKGARIYGKVRAADGKTPVRGAVVHAYHLGGGGAFASAPTASNGSYEIGGLPFGHFDLVVETDEGAFVSSEVVSVPPAGKALVLLTVRRYEDQPEAWWKTHGRRPLPDGAGDEGAGIAGVIRKARGAEFWKTPKGIAIIAGSGTAVLLAVATSARDDEILASPATP